MKALLAITLSLVVAVATWGAVFAINMGMKGGHEYFRAQRALGMMHMMEKASLDDGFPLLDGETYNHHIQQAWDHFKRSEDYEAFGNAEDSRYDFAFYQLRDGMPYFRWDKPPIYVVDPKLPDGFGFYLEGADGVSRTQGNDPDDINSWDIESTRHYHQVRWRNRRIAEAVTGLGAGAFSLLICSSLGAFKRRQGA